MQGSGSFATGDYNQDGITDVAYLNVPTSGTDQSSVQILTGTASGTVNAGETLPLVASSFNFVSEVGINSAILTSSGAIDLIVSGPDTVVYHGDGKGGFTPTGTYAAFGAPFSIAGYNSNDIRFGVPVEIARYDEPDTSSRNDCIQSAEGSITPSDSR